MKKIWVGLVLVISNTAVANQATKAVVSLGAKSGMHSVERISVNRILEALDDAYDQYKIGSAVGESVHAPVIGGPGMAGLSVSMMVSKRGATSLKKSVYFDLRGLNGPTRNQIKHHIESHREWIEDGQGFARVHSSSNEIIRIEGRDTDAIAVEMIHTRPSREYLNKLSVLMEEVNRLARRGSNGTILTRQQVGNTSR